MGLCDSGEWTPVTCDADAVDFMRKLHESQFAEPAIDTTFAVEFVQRYVGVVG
jgi:hypothetical protein